MKVQIITRIPILLTLLSISITVKSQQKDTTQPVKVYEHFRSTRLVNLHTVENVRAGVLELRISHRFGAINGGANELWGLDQATMRIGFEYGVTNSIMVGVGRSTFEKTYDGFIKWKLTEQKHNGFPFSTSYFGSISVNGIPFTDTSRTNYFSNRIAYAHQLIFAKKLNEKVTLQLSPTAIHRNLVTYADDKNLSFAVGIAGKYNLSKSLSINGEYIYRIQDGVDTPTFNDHYNSLSVGLGIETRGHFFELHLTNSFPMVEKGFVLETTDSWADGGIHFGFNMIRDFKITKKKS